MSIRSYSIFVSSTFNDMHAERDCINKRIVPYLNEQLRPYNATVSVIDLRWGVSTANLPEEEREAQVLHICMDAIPAMDQLTVNQIISSIH